MRLKAEIESKRLEAHKLMNAARDSGNVRLQEYYYGIFAALQWVQDKGNEETYLFD